jgi:hypothetical protein
MKNYKITVKHYLDNRGQKCGLYPVYVLLTYKRRVTRLKSAIKQRFADEFEMLEKCKDAIQKETNLIENAFAQGEAFNPNFDIRCFTNYLNENNITGLEVLEKKPIQHPEQLIR